MAYPFKHIITVGPNKRRAARSSSSPPNLAVSSERDLADVFNKTVVDKIIMVPIGQLKPHPKASRIHDESQIAMIQGSFKTFGFLIPLLVNADNEILAGHGRLQAAGRLGFMTLPVIRIDHLSPAQQRAYLIADNQIATKAGWDIELLAEELIFIEASGIDLSVTGFTVLETDIVIGEAEMLKAKPDKEDEPTRLPNGPAVTKLGDVWQLGEHRLICGSAVEPLVYDKLMQGREARIVVTDPPYNQEINGFVSGLGKVEHREFAMASGEMSKQEFFQFLLIFVTCVARYLMNGGLIYGFIDWRGQKLFMDALEAAGLTQINLCVWNKGSGGMGSFYRSQHELCLICKKGNEPHINNVLLGKYGRNRTNVWDHPGMSSFGKGRDEALAMHPTVKPVNLLVEAIKDASNRGDIVVDPFLGSGSTLIAAQKSGRICYGIELDPLYADVIIRRFEQFTGIAAVHAETGMTFTEMEELRRQEQVQYAGPPEATQEGARDAVEVPAAANIAGSRKRGAVVAAKEVDHV